jgi:phosphoglycerate dehydrogenase-like enzyme
LTRAGVDECEPYLKTYHFKLTAGKKIQGPNVSEHCMAMLLSISRGLFDQYKLNKYTHRPTEILNKSILIVGLGGIGTEVAKKLNVFGAKVDSIDHSFTKKNFIGRNYNIESLIKIAKNYDVIINCLPLTKITKNLFDKRFFYSMKKLSIFLSVSRDQTINIKDFKKFLKTKKLFGVAIDNTGSFKMKNKVEYNKKYNFLLTDHLAGVTTDNHRRAKLIYDNIDAYAKNKKINFLVSKQKGY